MTDLKYVTCGGSFVGYGTNVRQIARMSVFLFFFYVLLFYLECLFMLCSYYQYI